jgi:hypothetical protein
MEKAIIQVSVDDELFEAIDALLATAESHQYEGDTEEEVARRAAWWETVRQFNRTMKNKKSGEYFDPDDLDDLDT